MSQKPEPGARQIDAFSVGVGCRELEGPGPSCGSLMVSTKRGSWIVVVPPGCCKLALWPELPCDPGFLS